MPQNEEMRRVFARNLRTLLEQREKTQVDLAHFLGVANTAVSAWCRGKKIPRLDKIDRICAFLGTDRATLMGDDPKPPSLQSAHAFPCTEEERALIQKFRHLPPSGRETVKAVVDVQYKAVATAGSRKDTS